MRRFFVRPRCLDIFLICVSRLSHCRCRSELHQHVFRVFLQRSDPGILSHRFPVFSRRPERSTRLAIDCNLDKVSRRKILRIYTLLDSHDFEFSLHCPSARIRATRGVASMGYRRMPNYWQEGRCAKRRRNSFPLGNLPPKTCHFCTCAEYGVDFF